MLTTTDYMVSALYYCYVKSCQFYNVWKLKTVLTRNNIIISKLDLVFLLIEIKLAFRIV